MFRKTLLATAVAISATPVFAAVVNPKPQAIETLLVTATRTEQPVFKTLAAVTVINKDEIRAAQAASLIDLLGALPGIDTKHNGGRGASSSISIRGTESDHVLVLIDGVRTSGATNGTTSLESIPVELIERIEIVRGPRSSLYGAEAIGGVIQVFTKKGSEGLQGEVTTEMGSHELNKTSVGVRGALGNTRYSVNGIYEYTAGMDRTVKNGSVDDDRDAYRENVWSTSVDHQFDSGAATGFSMMRNDGETEFDSGGDDFTQTVFETRNAYISAPVAENLSARMDVSRFRETEETFGSFPGVFETVRDAYVVQLDYKVYENHLLTAGYDYYNDQVDATESFAEDERDNAAVFLQYQADFGRFNTTASVRQDDNEAFGEVYTRSFSIGYELSDTLLASLSYGTAFKAPTFNDLYYPYVFYSGFGFWPDYEYEGNAALKPEHSESIEFLLKGVGENYSWYFSVYETKIKDLIELVTVVDTPLLTSQTVDNISEAKILGTEMGATVTVWGINVTPSLTYADHRNEETDEMLQGRARGKLALELSRSFADLDLAMAWQTQSYRYDAAGERMGGYNTVDLRAEYHLSPKFSVAAKVENLFNKQYRYTPRFETEGQTASVSATYSF